MVAVLKIIQVFLLASVKYFLTFPYAILIGLSTYALSYLIFNSIEGWIGILIRTFVFSVLFGYCIIYWKISPDANQLFVQTQERLRKIIKIN